LSQDGILVVVVTLSKQKGTILSGPDIISRGFVYVRESEKLLEEANEIVSETLEKCMDDNVNEWASLKTSVREELGRYLYEKTTPPSDDFAHHHGSVTGHGSATSLCD